MFNLARHHWLPEWRFEGKGRHSLKAWSAWKQLVKLCRGYCLRDSLRKRMSRSTTLWHCLIKYRSVIVKTSTSHCRTPPRWPSYEDLVHNSLLGKIARFWLSLMEHTCLILMLQYSVKTNNFPISTSVTGIWLTFFRIWRAKLHKSTWNFLIPLLL